MNLGFPRFFPAAALALLPMVPAAAHPGVQ
jgi:hypothetical protein